MKKPEVYQVSVVRPDGVSISDMKDYIDDALNSWWGQFRPPGDYEYPEGDPRWGLKFKNVKRTKESVR